MVLCAQRAPGKCRGWEDEEADHLPSWWTQGRLLPADLLHLQRLSRQGTHVGYTQEGQPEFLLSDWEAGSLPPLKEMQLLG